MSFEAIPFPTGQSNQHLYNWGTNLAANLRQILASVAGGDADLTELQAAITSLQEDVTALETATGNLTPQFFSEHDLITAGSDVRNSMAEIADRQRTQLEQNAVATIKAAIEAHRGSTGIRTQVTVNEGVAQVLNSVMAALGVTGADLTELRQAIATGDAASSSYILSASSQVAGNIAEIQIIASSVDGIATRFGVVLNNQGEVTGAIQLDGTPAGSTFTVAVDTFRVAQADEVGGESVPVFAIQTVDGVAKIAFVGDMLADGSITARTISAGAITADKLDVDALSAITADLGTVTAGLIRNTANTLRFDLSNMRLYRTDNKMDIDLKNLRFRIGSG